jgi:hypothetical protein
MKTNEVHRLLRKELNQPLREFGFELASGNRAVWRLWMVPSGWFFLKAECDPLSGAGPQCFRFILEAGPSNLISLTELGGPLGSYLSGHDKRWLLKLANQARRDLGQPEEARWNQDTLPFAIEGHIRQYAAVIPIILPRTAKRFARRHRLTIVFEARMTNRPSLHLDLMPLA